jgi:hypothetical protein
MRMVTVVGCRFVADEIGGSSTAGVVMKIHEQDLVDLVVMIEVVKCVLMCW